LFGLYDFYGAANLSMYESGNQMHNLTSLERRCLYALVNGKTSTELQQEFQLSGFTIQIIIGILQKKLEVRGIAGLVSLALRDNLVESS